MAAAAEGVRALAQQRSVRLVIEDAGANGVEVPGDETQLVSAVANLIDNAVKYSDAGSSVRVGPPGRRLRGDRRP